MYICYNTFKNQDANFPAQEPLMAWPEDFFSIKKFPKLTKDDLAIPDSFTPGMRMSIMAGLKHLKRQKNNRTDLLPAYFAYTRNYIPSKYTTIVINSQCRQKKS